jgi:hypothetical protein
MDPKRRTMLPMKNRTAKAFAFFAIVPAVQNNSDPVIESSQPKATHARKPLIRCFRLSFLQQLGASGISNDLLDLLTAGLLKVDFPVVAITADMDPNASVSGFSLGRLLFAAPSVSPDALSLEADSVLSVDAAAAATAAAALRSSCGQQRE